MILPIRSPKVSVKNKLLSIVLVCGATVFFSLLSLFLLVQRTERLWFEYSNHLEARRILVTTMLNAAGYGRGIHAFKNLVLRGDLAYAAVARQGFDDSISAAEAYLTIEDIEPRELKAVQIFKKTLTEYRDNIARAVQMIDQKAPVAEIDALVKVDDTPAVAGLEEVLSHLVEHETLAQAAQLDALRQFWWIALGIVFIFFGLGAGYAYLLGSTLSSGLRTLRKSATDLEAGRLDREIVCNTGDELQSLAETFDHMRVRLAGVIADLKASNKELNRIAYISAHHLQEPIKKALLTTDLLEEEVRDKVDLSSNENWQRVKRALHRASVLKLDLHAYLKLFTAEPLHERVELNQVIETVCRSLAQSIEAVNGTVEVEKLPCLLGDPQEFTDLFLHLIDNALKYRHPDRNPQVLIEGAAPLDGRVTLRVTDNGIGMPESRIETALELFGRLHNDTESEGTGLGLALVRRTVEMFGGVLSIESKEGLGTVVFFDLPVAPPSDLLVGNG